MDNLGIFIHVDLFDRVFGIFNSLPLIMQSYLKTCVWVRGNWWWGGGGGGGLLHVFYFLHYLDRDC